MREWFPQQTRLRIGTARARDFATGDTGAGGVGATRLGGVGVTAGACGTGGVAAAAPGGARTRGTGAAGTGSVRGVGAGGAGAGDPVELGGAGAGGARTGGTGARGAGAGGARAGDTGAIGAGAGGTGAGARAGGAVSGGTGAGGTVRSRPFFVPLLRQVLSLPSSTGLPPSLLSPPPCPSQPQLQPGSKLPAPSPYAKQTDSLTERCEPESRPASHVCAVCPGRRVPRPRPPPWSSDWDSDTSVPLRVPLPPPPESSLPAILDPESDLARAACPTVSRLLATVVIDPSFESTTASALVAELVDFAAVCHLDYPTALVAESESASPLSVGGECALGTDVLEDRDHFLSLDPTVLTVDLLEQHLLAAETSVVTVGAARDTPRTPFFEGCSPSPLAPSYASAIAVDVLGTEDVGAASTSAKHRSSKGKGSKGGGGGSGSGGGGSSGGSGGSGDGGAVGVVAGVGALVEAVEAAVGVVVPATVAVVEVGLELSVEVREVASGSGSSVGARPHRPSSFLLRSGAAIFDVDFDAILSTMYALSASAEGDCYLCVPPELGIEAATLSASESSLPGTAPAEALHTFMLDSGASRCFFHDSTTLTPLPASIPVRLADPSGGPIIARSSTVLPCLEVPSCSLSGLHLPSFSKKLVSTAALQDAMVTTTTPGGQRVSICTCTRTGRRLATFTRRHGPICTHSLSSLLRLFYGTITWDTPPCHDFVACTPGLWSSQVSASPPALACPALPSLRRGAAVRRSSLLLVSPDDYSPADSPHGRVLQRFSFHLSSPQPTPLSTGHSLSAPPLDEFGEPSGPSSCEAEIYVGAMAAQELRWLTYLLTDLGEQPRSPPVLYVDNKAMIALCQDHSLEHRTKHIALRYFLARDLQ
ncbi:unnamed protein product [Closterium sp. NIES-53]